MKLTKKHKEAIKFCELVRTSFSDAQTIYSYSACFGFYKIFKSVFPEATAYEVTYDGETQPSHVMANLGGEYFDINGLYFITDEGVSKMSEYKYFGWEGNHQGMRSEWIISKRAKHYKPNNG